MNSWSYSAYSSAVRCLKLYKYAYIDKITVEGPLGGDLIFGSALHSAINAVLTGQDGASTFQIYWMSYKDKEVEYGRYGWEDLASLGNEFIRKFTKLHAPKYELEFAEQRLYAEYRGVKLEGTPDYLGKYNGEQSLRDFKTSGYNYKQEKAQCALQLNLYAFLVRENKVGVDISTLGYTVFNKGTGSIQDLTWKFNETSMYKALDDLYMYCDQIEAVSEFPRNLNACLDYNRRCVYWDLCHTEGVKND